MTPHDERGSPADWFPPERGPVLVVGNAGSIFTRHLASLWRSLGLDARLVTRRLEGARVLADGTPVTVTSDTESRFGRRAYDSMERVACLLESQLIAMQSARFRKAMGSETSYRPTLSPSLVDAVSISRTVDAMRPQFVCGQEVFAYGLATALSRTAPRLLMPWGGDVYMYADTTTIASVAVGAALRHVDLVVPGSTLARDYLHTRFGVPIERMHCGGLWALDRNRFQRANIARRTEICARYGIRPDALIVMNIRRFFPAWGADLAFEAFVRFAREHPTVHCVMLGGSGTEALVAQARRVLAREGLSGRFTMFDGDVPLEECAALMAVSDVCVSLMRERDMRPFASILEAVSCGASPILGDQREYRLMEQEGFRATFCRVDDAGEVVAALRTCAAGGDPARAHTHRANLQYIDIHENGRDQAIGLLWAVRRLRDGHPKPHGSPEK